MMNIQEIVASKLEREIQKLRIKMIITGCTKGLTHPNTIKYSKTLDRKLNIYQKMLFSKNNITIIK